MTAPGEHAFPKEARLRTPAEFARVQREGRTHDLGPLVFRLAARPTVPEGAARARLGLAVSKRVGGAVVRNRVKRRVRECFRLQQAALAGLDLVVTARPAAATLEQRDVAVHFTRLLAQLGRRA